MSPRNAKLTKEGRIYTLPGGEKVPSVTTVLGILDKPWMGPWAAKMVATEAVDNRTWWSELARDEAISYLKGFPFRKRDEAGELGTAVHEVSEALASDLPFDVPAYLLPYYDALRAWHDAYRPEVLATEWQVAGGYGDYGYAGSFDLLARVHGRVYLIDLKTSKEFDHKWRLQVAAYMAGTPFRDGEYLDWPALPDAGAVLWVPSDRPEQWQFLELDLEAADHEAFAQARAIYVWNQRRKKDPGASLVLPRTEDME